MNSPKVKVVCDSPLARKARITIDGVSIPCTYAAIEFRPDELVTLTLETRADLVDVEVLQSQTEILVREERKEWLEEQSDHWPEKGEPSKN